MMTTTIALTGICSSHLHLNLSQMAFTLSWLEIPRREEKWLAHWAVGHTFLFFFFLISHVKFTMDVIAGMNTEAKFAKIYNKMTAGLLALKDSQ